MCSLPIQCVKCGNEIHPLRLQAVPNTKVCHVCIKNNDVERVGGVQIITGKTTYAELQIVSAKSAAKINHLQNRKGGIVSQGVKGIRHSRELGI